MLYYIVGNSILAILNWIHQLEPQAKVELFLSPIISVDNIKIASYTTITVFHSVAFNFTTKLW